MVFTFSYFIYSAGKMQVSWGKLRPTTRKILITALERAIPKMKLLEISLSFYGLGLCDARWSDFPLNARNTFQFIFASTIPNMSAQNLANLLYG